MTHLLFVEMSATGAGERCLDYAKGRGYETTVLTARPDGYGTATAAATRVVRADTEDRDALRAAADELARRHPVHAVTTTADYFVPAAATVAAHLGLPGLAVEAAEGVRNKYRMRRTLHRTLPAVNPPFRLVRTAAEAAAAAAELGYPLVAKPQDGNDSWNVTRIDAPGELAAYLQVARDWTANADGVPVSDGVLLEGYLDGPEFTVETAHTPGGPPQLIGVTGKGTDRPGQRWFPEVTAWYPVCGPVADLLFARVTEALAALRIDCGVIHTECRLVGGEVKILEVNPRLTGDLMGSHVIELASGASPAELVVETALGRPVRWRPTRKDVAAIVGICPPVTGRFAGVRNAAELRGRPGVALVRVTGRPGATYRCPPRSNLDIVGWVVATAPDERQAVETATRVAAAAAVEVDPCC